MKQLTFLEGPPYAGKTTYLNSLEDGQSLIVPEASEFLGGDSNFPEAPVDAETMAYCSYYFGYMEKRRLDYMAKLSAGNINADIVADRYTPLSSMMFYRLRFDNGDIDNTTYAGGLVVSSEIFGNVPQPTQIDRYGFMLFDLSTEEEFARRSKRGTRSTDFNSWINFKNTSATYKSLLPAGTTIVRDNDTRGAKPSWVSAETPLRTLTDPKLFMPNDGLPPITDALRENFNIARIISPSRARKIRQSVDESIVYE